MDHLQPNSLGAKWLRALQGGSSIEIHNQSSGVQFNTRPGLVL
jgi:hypothetical protein